MNVGRKKFLKGNENSFGRSLQLFSVSTILGQGEDFAKVSEMTMTSTANLKVLRHSTISSVQSCNITSFNF